MILNSPVSVTQMHANRTLYAGTGSSEGRSSMISRRLALAADEFVLHMGNAGLKDFLLVRIPQMNVEPA